MKIGIEAQRIFRPDKHGMDFVILEVLRLLQQEDDGNEYVVFTAPGADRCLHDTPHMHIEVVKCPTYPLWEQWALPRAVRRTGVRLLHCTSNTAPLYCPVPLILTLHDIIYLESPCPVGMSAYQRLGWYYRRWNVPRIVHHCHSIIAVSQTAMADILQRFPHLADRMQIVYNGYSDCYHPLPEEEIAAITNQYLPKEESGQAETGYLLHLGNTDPRKNTEGVLLAYHEYLHRSKRKLKLILTGMERESVLRLLSHLGIETCASNILCPGYVPGVHLPALYNGAFAFLYPSFKEGFGIPILEAMACGTPVITGNTSAMPEVAGNGALLIDPQQPQQIADALLHLESSPKFFQQQKAYGLERAKQFAWQQTAEAYRNIYRRLMQA